MQVLGQNKWVGTGILAPGVNEVGVMTIQLRSIDGLSEPIAFCRDCFDEAPEFL
jgi:hypothetical protein